MDELSEEFQEGGGVVILNPKLYVADFKQGFMSIKFEEKNCSIIFRKWRGGVKCRLELFRFGSVTRP